MQCRKEDVLLKASRCGDRCDLHTGRVAARDASSEAMRCRFAAAAVACGHGWSSARMHAPRIRTCGQARLNSVGETGRRHLQNNMPGGYYPPGSDGRDKVQLMG